MRKLYLVFVAVLIGLFLFSCGLKLPSKAPEKVKVQYTKYLEFPITTLDLKVSDFVDSLLQESIPGLSVVKADPISIKYATSIEYSPGTFLQDIENSIQTEFQSFEQSFEYRVDSSYFLSTVTGKVTLPTLQPIQQSVSVDAVDIGSFTIAENQSMPVANGTNIIELPSSVLNSLIFSEANLKSVDVQFTINGVSASNAFMIVDGVSYPITVNGTKNLTNVMIKKTSTVKIKFDSSSSGLAQATLKFLNQKVDYFKNLDTTQLSDGKISINVTQNIPITTGTWKLALGGNVDVNLNILGFSGNISQSYTAKSGTITIGSGSSLNLTCNIGFDGTKLFTVGDGIVLDGVVELSGTVSADLRTPPSITITPNVNVTKIENYPLNVTVPLPSNVQSVSFTNDSGYMLLKLSGVTLTAVSGTFGSNNLSLSGGIVLPFGGISLPSTINAQISGNVNSNEISYTLELPEDQTIKISNAEITGISIDPVTINEPVPSSVKDFANSVKATIKVKLNYDVTNISGVSLNVTSNIFDTGNGTHNLSGVGTIVLSAVDKVFDFSTFTNFTMTITPVVPTTVTVSNVDIREGVKLIVQPVIEQFEISEVNLKGQTFEQDLGTLINFGDIFKDDFAFVKDLDINVDATVTFNITETTVPATVTLNVSGKEFKISKGQKENIGTIIEELISEGAPLSLSIIIETGTGTLTKDSLITASLEFALPLSASTGENEILIKSGTVDLSTLNNVKDILNKVELKFGYYSNTTGLQAVLKLGSNDEVSTLIGVSQPIVTIPNDKLQVISNSNVPYKILLPASSTISLNYNGKLNIAPYIAVDLKVATEVKLGN
ncbi:hypothetical protein QQE94_08960 [Fervidobacterium pennivorans subsp. shakshaketiis]|jgi:hypothetical protein|uniref:Uncharacterized protein n=1 Tax=Fervidobacterium pennivorans (strain DSM 9078 / Ven5) TaxID=771875 RepID=H9UEL8_FERPD|nr:hypothetical protein [Fervidobacterium pennivorans]AFG35961.1 hypothetical protein Ferpe_1912 [Fervidobacterium pennivorans DSM 9078]QIV79019.1 hypothetical protein HER11_08895 [Fervidobacterium pennivorans subsp. keratinolyticus]